MNTSQHYHKILLLMVGILFLVPPTASGTLSDEIEAISSSIQGYVMNNDAKIEEEAQRLAGIYGDELIPFTATHIQEVDFVGNYVLLRGITKLPDRAAVQDALYSMAMSAEGSGYQYVITSIAFCERDEIVSVAFRLAENTQSYNVANTALALLDIFGNDSTIASLAQLEESVSDEKFKGMISATRENLADRMNSSDAVRQEWNLYAPPYWRIPREVTQLHSVVMNYFLQAELLNRRGYHFPVSFLKARMEENDPLAAALLAVQKESDCIEDLEAHLSDEGLIDEVCRMGIAHIEGTEIIDLSYYFPSAAVNISPEYRPGVKKNMPDNDIFTIKGQMLRRSVDNYSPGIYLRTPGNNRHQSRVLLHLNPASGSESAGAP